MLMPTLGAYVVWGLGECQKEINDNKVLYWGAGAGAEPERGGVCVWFYLMIATLAVTCSRVAVALTIREKDRGKQ